MLLSDDGLRTALEALVAGERLRPGRGYGKAELLQLLRGPLGDAADAAFTKVRAAAATTEMLAGLRVRAQGERRGCRYFFGDAGAESTAGADGRERDETPGAREHAAPPRRYVAPAAPEERGTIEIHFGDNLPIISGFPDCTFDLIYIDPPFNTRRTQARTQIATVLDDEGDRVGFKGKRYRTTRIGTKAFADTFDDYLEFLAPRLEQAHRLLNPTGSLFLHLDFREVHYAKVLLDQIFGRDCFVNEIIWAYDYGARATRRWSPKHDNILWYAKTAEGYCFNYDAIDRIPYMAPDLVGEEKAARGKTPTDTWWHTIVSPNGHEKTGYPTQKPLGVLRRLVTVHSNPGDRLLDFFAGSGTLGEAGAGLGRDVVLVDANPEALDVMTRRLHGYAPILHGVDASSVGTQAAVVEPQAGAHPAPADGNESVERGAQAAEEVSPTHHDKRAPRPSAATAQARLFE